MEEKLFELADTVHKYNDARSNGNGFQQRGTGRGWEGCAAVRGWGWPKSCYHQQSPSKTAASRKRTGLLSRRRLAVVIIDGNFDADSFIEPLLGNEEVNPNKVVTVSARPKWQVVK
uniref:Uncharacterized protein n=1 Tax=Oryza meridionalis TaxID=40149 RepID=A0A0E0EA76_9ORYZ